MHDEERLPPNSITSINFICCFCGRRIDEIDPDPCTLTVETRQGRWQLWTTHSECFQSRLAPDAPVDLSPGIFDV